MDENFPQLDRSDRFVIAKLAWGITLATALAALICSFLPGSWAAHAFVQLRWATLFYGTAAAFYLITSGKLVWLLSAAEPAPQGYEPGKQSLEASLSTASANSQQS